MINNVHEKYQKDMAQIKINQEQINKLFNNMFFNGTKKEQEITINMVSKCLKEINKKDSLKNQSHSNCGPSIFTNNKNCNNVKVIGGYSNNTTLSRDNTYNGIAYSATIF